MTERKLEINGIPALAIISIIAFGSILGAISFFTAQVPVFYTCWEHPDDLNETEWIDKEHEVVQLDGTTERWRSWTGLVKLSGPVEHLSTMDGNGKDMNILNYPQNPSKAASWYGHGVFTDRFQCER